MAEAGEEKLDFRVIDVQPAKLMEGQPPLTLIQVEVTNQTDSPLQVEFFPPTLVTSKKTARADTWIEGSFRSGTLHPGQPVLLQFAVETMKVLSIQYGDTIVFKWSDSESSELCQSEWPVTEENTCELIPLEQLKNRMKSLAFLRDGFEAMEREEYPLSLKFFSKVLELDPNNVVAIGHRGLAQSYLDQHEAALEDYSAALTLSPSEAGWKLFRGISYFHLGRKEEARRDLESYLQEGDPDEESRERAEEYLNKCN